MNLGRGVQIALCHPFVGSLVLISNLLFFCLGCVPEPEESTGHSAKKPRWEALVSGDGTPCFEGDECLTGLCVEGHCAGLLSGDSEWAQSLALDGLKVELEEDPAIAGPLYELLASRVKAERGDSLVRVRALRGIGIFSMERKEALLMEALKSPMDSLRFWSAWELTREGSEKGVVVLTSFLGASSETLRLRALDAFQGGSLPLPEAIQWMTCEEGSRRVALRARHLIQEKGRTPQCVETP